MSKNKLEYIILKAWRKSLPTSLNLVRASVSCQLSSQPELRSRGGKKSWSLVGMMLWVRYALLKLHPWLSLSDIYARYLESPGTKAYSITEAKKLFSAFKNVTIQTVLTHGDLLSSQAGQRHQGPLLVLARKLWPRNLLRRYFPGFGLFMLIEAQK